jgi:hypothetical protein
MGRTACTEPQCLYSRAIPLLPLWAARPVQNVSACTVELYLCSPYGPYGLYRASVPVQQSYTSTPPMGRTACTEPQCLYKCALLHVSSLGVIFRECAFVIEPDRPYYTEGVIRSFHAIEYTLCSTVDGNRHFIVKKSIRFPGIL